TRLASWVLRIGSVGRLRRLGWTQAVHALLGPSGRIEWRQIRRHYGRGRQLGIHDQLPIVKAGYNVWKLLPCKSFVAAVDAGIVHDLAIHSARGYLFREQ